MQKKTHQTIEKIEVLNLALVGAGVVIGWITGMIHVPSFLLGGGVMHLNFWLLKKVVRSALSSANSHGEHMRGKVRTTVWLLVKGGLYILLLSAVFVHYPIDAKSFVAGVPLLLIACVIVGLSSSGSQSEHLDLPHN